MNSKTKKVIAREWLYLISLIVLGFILAILVDISAPYSSDSDFYTFVLLPYIILQIIRAIIWAVKTLKSSSD